MITTRKEDGNYKYNGLDIDRILYRSPDKKLNSIFNRTHKSVVNTNTRKEPLKWLFLFKNTPAAIVLDLLHAQKVSLMNLRFKSAQFLRYPD